MPPELCETPLEIPVVALDFVLAAIVDALAANAPRHPTLIWVIVRFRTSSSTVMLNSKSLREGTLVHTYYFTMHLLYYFKHVLWRARGKLVRRGIHHRRSSFTSKVG